MNGKGILRRLKPESYIESYKSLLRLGVPVLITQLGVIIVNFADTMMVGAYGLNELAASAFVNSIFVVVSVMLMGFAGGVTPLIGALYGRDEHAEGGRMLRGALQVNVILALIFTLLLAMVYPFLDRFGQDPELLPAARSYYLIILFTLLPMAVFNCFQQTANGTTDTATPMWIILGCDVLNIGGNYLLIFGKWGCPELGLTGAGISTLIARTAAAVAIVATVAWRRRYRPYWNGLTKDSAGKERRMKVWNTSYPLMVQSGVECGMWAFGGIVSGWFGKIQLAAYQVMNTIAQLGFMTYMGFGWATSIRVANFTGQGNVEGVRQTTKAGLHLVMALATIASAGFFFFTTDLVHFFTPEAEVAVAALTLVVPLILYQYCDGAQLTFINALRGTSVVKPLLWISIVSYIVVGIPALLLFAKGFNLGGVYYSFSVALATATILSIIAFRKALTGMSIKK